MVLSEWLPLVANHFIANNDASFGLPYLSNSPAMMVESLSQLPVVHSNPEQQYIYSDNPYCQGIQYYRQLDEGLWLLGTELTLHKDIISRALYVKDLPANYYFLSFAVFEYGFSLPHEPLQVTTILSTTCTFYKPCTEVATYFYAGSKGRFYNIAFTKEWVEKNIAFNTPAAQTKVLAFLNNETGFLNWIDIVPDAEQLTQSIWHQLQNEAYCGAANDWYKHTLTNIIEDFFHAAFAGDRLQNYSPLFNKDYALVALAEKHLLNNLCQPFMGVEALAKAAGMSATKLKTIFKSVFGFSMLQYHKEKNLLLARQLVQRSSMQIKNIAGLAGYQTASKFSAAYKKRFGSLPAQERNQ